MTSFEKAIELHTLNQDSVFLTYLPEDQIYPASIRFTSPTENGPVTFVVFVSDLLHSVAELHGYNMEEEKLTPDDDTDTIGDGSWSDTDWSGMDEGE